MLGACVAVALLAPQSPVPPRFELARPLPGLPGILVDRRQHGAGIGQQLALAKGLQARILWIDATANLERFNSEEKIVMLADRIRLAGFTTIVLDVKPISGQVIYPSELAPKLVEWRGRRLPLEFDPVATFCRAAARTGLELVASLNAFSEGHRMFQVGPGYEHKDWQTILYEPAAKLDLGGERLPVHLTANLLGDESAISVFSDAARVPKLAAGQFAVTVDSLGRLVDGFSPAEATPGPTLPRGGTVAVAQGGLADRLRAAAIPGSAARYVTEPLLVPIEQRPEQQFPLMTNPLQSDVRARNLAIVAELALKYPIDGMVYDDRLRFGGLNADFSPAFRAAFESWLGRKVARWPEDVYEISFGANFLRGIRPGPDYENWLIFRAATIRGYVEEVRKTLIAVRPAAKFGVYAGSWYGEYATFGANYGSEALDAGFWFLSPEYRQTGFASELDFLITGCYYPSPTIYEAMTAGRGIGASIESAGYLSNRVADDRTWVYAGISLDQFRGNPEGLGNALQAACASTQGVMVFDLSHDIDPMWPVFQRAFAQAKRPPHALRADLAELRRRDDAFRKSGRRKPTVVISTGQPGTGH